MRRVALAGGLMALGLLAAACSGGGDSTTAGVASSAPASAAPASSAAPDYGSGGGTAATPSGQAVTINAKSVDLGSILVDDKGMTLYLFEADKDGQSACDDACAEAWPPLLADSAATAGSGVDAALLGTTKRSDGTTQVTYHNWPLYYYVDDQAPGDITGQDVDSFGAKWYVIGSEKGDKLEQ